jgi:hypothetical protein
MPARYHPISSTLWSDVRLEGLRFEAKAFFCYLCSNDHLRPSGIYRVTDKQLAGETDLSVRTVHGYCQELAKRALIVRDGSWLFVRKYLKRQPKTDWLLRGVERDILDCDSSPVLMEFGECYPHLYRWSADRLEKVARRSPDRCIYTEQSRAEQNRAEQSKHPCSDGQETVAATPPAFQIPDSIRTALTRTTQLASIPRLQTPTFWQAQIRARPEVDFPAEVLKAEAWLAANPKKAPRSNVPGFLQRWFAKAAEQTGG